MTTQPRTWAYESSWERKQRELAEFDVLAGNALESVADPDPLRMESARQAVDTWANRDARKDAQLAMRQSIAERVRQQREQQERNQSVLGRIGAAVKTVGGAALEGLERGRQAGLGIATGDYLDPVGNIGRAIGGLRGERYSGEDIVGIRHLPEDSRARSVAGRVGEEFTDPLNLLIALKGPVLATRIAGSSAAAKAARMMLEPIVTGPAAGRVAAEAGVAALARYGGEAAMGAVPEDAPEALRVGAALAGGLVAGAGTATAIGSGQRGVRAGVRAAEDAALEGALRRPLDARAEGIRDRVQNLLADRSAARQMEGRVAAGGADEPVQGGLEGIRPDQPTFRPENMPLEQQAELGIGAGTRPVEDLPMFSDPVVTDSRVSAPREVFRSEAFDTDQLPDLHRIEARLDEMREAIAYTDAGAVSTSKVNRMRLQQIGELEAAADVRRAIDQAGGDHFKAMEAVEAHWQQLSETFDLATARLARGGRTMRPAFGSQERAAWEAARRADAEMRGGAGGRGRGARTQRQRAQTDIGIPEIAQARIDTLAKVLDTMAFEVRIDPPDTQAFAARYGIDLQKRIETPEERSLRETVSRLERMADSAGLRKTSQRDALIGKAAEGDRIATSALQRQINDARARQGKGNIRLKQTIEQTRERGVELRRSVEDDLRGVDLSDGARAGRLADALGIRDVRKPIAAKFENGRPLTELQTQTFTRMVLNRMERMAPEDRARALRDAGYEAAAPEPVAPRMDSDEVRTALVEAGFVEHNGRFLKGPSGDFAEQARNSLPDDSPVLRLAEGRDVPSGSQLERRPPPQEPPPPPPGGPRDAGGPFEPDDPAMRMPERGFGGADGQIAMVDEVYRDPGRIAAAVDAVAEKARGGPTVIRRIRSILDPRQNHVRRVMVAYNAEGNTYAQLASEFKAVYLGLARQLESAWDASPPVYRGPADAKLRGTPIHFAQNPSMYEASPDLMAAARAIRDFQDGSMIPTVRGNYNVDVLPFRYSDTDAFHVPHISRQATNEEAFTQTSARLYSSGRRKHRVYETLDERMKADPDFVPETDLETLFIHHAEAMARMAAQETFIRASGGMTRVEFIEAVQPGLRANRDAVKRQVDNLNERVKTAYREGRVEARETRRIAGQMTAQERRAQPILDRLEDLGYEGGTHRLSEWGSELSHEAGRLREIGLQWRHLRAELIRRGERVQDIEARYASLNREYDAAVERLEELRQTYDAAAKPGTKIGDTEYAMSSRTLRWHPTDEARAIDALYRTSDGTPLGTLQTGMEHWRGAVVTLDATFATIHGVFAALMNGPRAIRQAADAFVINARDPDRLLKLAQREPELTAEFARSSGFEWGIRGRERTGGELARDRGLEAIRYKGIGQRIQDFNDMQWRAVTEIVYEGWKKDRAALIEAGFTPNAASAAASEVVWSVVPRMNPRRSGRSAAHGEFERMMMISPSFLYQPAILMKDATSALAKMAIARGSGGEAWGALLPRERLALKRYSTLMGTIMGIAATSAVIFSPLENKSPDEALMEVFNPRSSKFMSFNAFGQGTVALGGAHRAMARALFPRTDADGNLDPLAGVTMLLKGKQHPAIRSVLDQFAGRDFFGNDIEEGRMPFGLANRLWYAAEMGMPIWTQPISQAARGSQMAPQSLLEGMLQATFGTLGYSYYERSPFEQFDRIARGRYGSTYHDLPPAQQAELRDEFPDLWSASIRRGREQRAQYQMHLAEVSSQQQESDRMLASGEITRERWLADFRQRQQMLAGYREAIFADSPQSDRNTPIDRYFEQIDLAKGVDGVVDWEAVDEWKATLTPDEQEYIDENTGVSRTVLGRVYRNVSKTYAQYLSLPKYQGYDSDEAREIDGAWQQVRNRAAELAGARDIEQRHMIMAYRELQDRLAVDGRIDRGVQMRILGRLRQVQDRQRFRQQHPDIELFYGRGPLTDLQRQRILDLGNQTMRTHEDDVMRELAGLLRPGMPALQGQQAAPALSQQVLRDRIAALR